MIGGEPDTCFDQGLNDDQHPTGCSIILAVPDGICRFPAGPADAAA